MCQDKNWKEMGRNGQKYLFQNKGQWNGQYSWQGQLEFIDKILIFLVNWNVSFGEGVPQEGISCLLGCGPASFTCLSLLQLSWLCIPTTLIICCQSVNTKRYELLQGRFNIYSQLLKEGLMQSRYTHTHTHIKLVLKTKQSRFTYIENSELRQKHPIMTVVMT